MTVRVLYVTGWCRSGSTILANLLNEVAGVVHVGELHYLWANGVLHSGTNRNCGCGRPVADCPLWSAVLRDTDPDVERAVAQQRLLRTRHTRRRLAESTGRTVAPAAVTTAAARIAGQYRAVAAATGADLVVDSSKYPAEPAALLGHPDLDLRVLHLIRDPRASAYSWVRPKAYIPAMSVRRSTAYWTGFNLASEALAAPLEHRYLRLRYEDFVRRPRREIGRVLEHVGVPASAPIDDEGRAELGGNHTVTGNPDRLVTGPVTIRDDGSWRVGLTRTQRRTVTALAAPLLGRYGYR